MADNFGLKIGVEGEKEFKKALAEVPKGLKTAIKIEVATRLDNGTFDSIQKVRAVDEICGTELEKMI